MFRSFVQKHAARFASLALWVFCLSALMPTLSAWVVSARASDGWLEVCSLQGPKWVRAGQDQQPDGSGQTYGGGGHCPFCLMQHHLPMLPQAPVALSVPPLAASALVPTLFLRSPRTPHVWSPAAARGPPALA